MLIYKFIMTSFVSTLCVLGTPAQTHSENVERVALAHEAIKTNDNKSHTYVLPGGMFFHDQALAPLSPAQRIKAVNDLPFVHELSAVCGNAMIISGLDISAPDECHAQYSIAIDKDGVKAVSRKAFPTKGEIKQGAFVQRKDFSDAARHVSQPLSHSVIMHTCYDIFGSVDALIGKTAPTRLSHVPHPKGSTKKECYQDYCSTLTDIKANAAPIVTVNIHDFTKPGRDIFYQRHGIATASAAFDGAAVFAAAHFEEELPSSEIQSPLAAINVPSSHITARFHRQAHALKAKEAHSIRAASQRGILRTFSI
jgi:hypothetical protein